MVGGTIRVRTKAWIIAGAAIMAGLGGGARAENACRMLQLAELPVTVIGAKATIPVKVNGRETLFFIDSGATGSVINSAWADRLGIKKRIRFGYETRGVAGDQALRDADAESFTVGDMNFAHANFLVEEGLPPAVGGLIGRNLLGGVDVEYDLGGKMVRLFKLEHCQSMIPTYWAQAEQINTVDLLGSDESNHAIVTDVFVNGHRLRALWDTGADASLLSRSGAARAGLAPTTAGAVPAGKVHGFGFEPPESWIAPVQSFALGREQISNTRLRFIDKDTTGEDMLLGFDFFQSHRVFVAYSQHKVYFTYNGGPVFQLDPLPATVAKPPAKP
jgi:predicted aspartyl protease